MFSCSLRTHFGFTAPCSWGLAQAADYDGRQGSGPISLQTPDSASHLKTLKHFPCSANLTLSLSSDQVAGSRSHIKIFKAVLQYFLLTLPLSGGARTDTPPWSHSALPGAWGPRPPGLAGPISAQVPPPAANQKPGLWASRDERSRDVTLILINVLGTQNHKRFLLDLILGDHPFPSLICQESWIQWN